jgi:ABC-type nitrate/sulfonate/bicarbonate transport system substrate-binding protein
MMPVRHSLRVVRAVAFGMVWLLVEACGPTARTADQPAAPALGAPVAAAAPASTDGTTGASAPGARSADAPLSPPATVRVGVVGSTSDAGIYIGMEKGYFREQGIEIELSEFQAAQQMVPLLGTGQLDVGGGATSAGLINAVALEIPIRIVADKGSTPPGFGYQGIVLRNELAGSFTGCTGFKALRVGTAAITNSFGPALARVLGECGLTISDVELVEMTFGDMGAALRNGAIDAAHIIEPGLTNGLSAGVYTLWKRTDEFYPDAQNAVLLYGPQFIANRREVGQRFMVAYIKGMRDNWEAFARGVNKAETIDILTRTTSVKDPALFERMAPSGLNPDGYINMRTFSDDLEWWVNQGHVRTRVDPAQVVDNSFVDYAIDRLGRYTPK